MQAMDPIYYLLMQRAEDESALGLDLFVHI